MASFKLGFLNSQNIGSVIHCKTKDSEVYGTIESLMRAGGTTQVRITGMPEPLSLPNDTVVDISLPPAAYFSKRTLDQMELALAELEDMNDELAAYFEARTSADEELLAEAVA